jgi:hypothetical protein
MLARGMGIPCLTTHDAYESTKTAEIERLDRNDGRGGVLALSAEQKEVSAAQNRDTNPY